MDIFSVFTLVGGLAMFLYGMSLMGQGLEKQAGSKLKGILERASATPIKGFLLGLSVTAIIQSSSATTVMVVGFVNSGLMKLSQAIGIIMGANVGTTVTAWILSLSGIQGDSFLIRLLKPTSFAPLLAGIGIILYMFLRDRSKKDLGTIFIGFAILMFGMEAMSGAVAPLAEVPGFTKLFVSFENPLIGVLVGAGLTAIIQSSSASVGILQALSSTGAITFGSAIPVIMGQNIGTCITAIISSIGTNKNARRTAVVHLYFNIIGTISFLFLFYSLNAIFEFAFIADAVTPVGIAIVHTIFNVLATSLMLPFTKGLEKLAYLTIPDDGQEQEVFQLLDERLLNTPAVAIAHCNTVATQMADLSRSTLLCSMSLVQKYDAEMVEKIMQNETQIDMYEDKLGTYLVKLSSQSLTVKDSHEISKLLHCIGDFERIGDHALNIMETAQEKHQKGIDFSEHAWKELNVLTQAVQSVLNLAVDSFEKNDLEIANHVEPLEDVVDYLKNELRRRHIERLQSNECTIELGFLYSDLLTNYERVADHCSNIAVCLITLKNNGFDTHEYLNKMKIKKGESYETMLKEYKKKFEL